MTSLRHLFLFTSCALLLLPLHAAAQEQRTFLDVAVNTVEKGDTLVVLRGEDALIGVAWLTQAGVSGFAGRRESIDGEEFVSLASLAPAVTFTLDERELRFAITASPDLLPSRVRDLHQGRPADLVYRTNSSGFLNYSVSTGSAGRYGVFSEGGLSFRGALLSSTLSMNQGSVVRGLTSLTIDDRSRIRRWTVGDTFASTGPLGGDQLLAGVTLAREFAVEPYFVRYPTLSLSTPVLMPSTVEVHVNGRLVREEQVQPGRLDMLNLPLTTGQNDTRIVVRDPFGGVRELAADFYSTTSVLARGIHDYQYSVGLRRAELATASWDYDKPALLARHRAGLTDTITAGGRLEAAPDVVSAGPIVNLRLPLGEIEATAAASQTAAGIGTAVSTSYAYSGRLARVGGSVRMFDAGYATLNLTPDSLRPRTELRVFAGVPIGRLSLSAQHSHGRLHDGTARVHSELLGSTQLGRHAYMTASLSRMNDRRTLDTRASVGLTIMFGDRTSVTTSVVRGADGTHNSIDLQRPLPIGTGYGYQVRTEDHLGLPSATAQYQGAHGRYEVRHESSGGRPHVAVNVSGALVGIGGSLFATRPVRGSYALVQVPGVKDVRGFSSNQEIGRTNTRGNILVPDLLPYYGNVLNISDSDIPIDYVVSKVQETIAPPYRGGALVRFPVQRIQTSEGRVLLLVKGEDVAPTYGELTVTVDGQAVASPLGAKGEFYFENLAPGRHPAAVAYADGTCRFTLEVPVAEGPVAKLGVVRCVVGK